MNLGNHTSRGPGQLFAYGFGRKEDEEIVGISAEQQYEDVFGCDTPDLKGFGMRLQRKNTGSGTDNGRWHPSPTRLDLPWPELHTIPDIYDYDEADIRAFYSSSNFLDVRTLEIQTQQGSCDGICITRHSGAIVTLGRWDPTHQHSSTSIIYESDQGPIGCIKFTLGDRFWASLLRRVVSISVGHTVPFVGREYETEGALFIKEEAVSILWSPCYRRLQPSLISHCRLWNGGLIATLIS